MRLQSPGSARQRPGERPTWTLGGQRRRLPPSLTLTCSKSSGKEALERCSLLFPPLFPILTPWFPLSSLPPLSQVYLARYKQTKQCYAIKVLQKKAIIRRNEVKHIMAERNVLLKNVQHPFLVGLHFSFQTSTKLYFVLDYVNGGELFFHLQRERVFEEPRAR